MTTNVSVMICTWNNSQRLAVTLGALSRCVIPDGLTWELIVVNNNCTDDTDWTVARFTSMLPIVYVHEPRQGLSNARNAGLGGAHGRLIIFTDDDVKPCPGWLAAYWAAYQAMPRGCYFGGPVESEFESGRPDEELLQIAMPSVKGMDWGPGPRRLIKGEDFAGANWACPTEAVAAAGGFDTSLGLDPSLSYMRGGEETDIMRRLRSAGVVPWYLPEARLSHFVPASKATVEHIGGCRLTAPFPYYGGKSRAAPLIWERLGRVQIRGLRPIPGAHGAGRGPASAHHRGLAALAGWSGHQALDRVGLGQGKRREGLRRIRAVAAGLGNPQGDPRAAAVGPRAQ